MIAQQFTCTITMIAATTGGPIIMERKIPLIMSLKNNHGVCCRIDDKNVRWNLQQINLLILEKSRYQIKLKSSELERMMKY